MSTTATTTRTTIMTTTTTTDEERQNEKEQRIIQLKRQALECKNNGDMDGAKMIMTKVREIELENMTVENCHDPAMLKQLALTYKGKGDIQNAKEALLKSRQILFDLQQQQQQQQQQQEQEEEQKLQQEQKEQEEYQQQILLQKQVQEQKDHDNLLLQNLKQTQKFDDNGNNHNSNSNNSNNNATITYTDEEMLDTEMMCELKSSGMEVPSETQYQGRILAYKKEALNYKNNGDIQNAKLYLAQSKKLQHVMDELSKITFGGGDNNNNSSSNLESTDINPEEEAWLLKELGGNNNNNNNNDDDDIIFMDDDNGNHYDPFEDMANELLNYENNQKDFELDDLDDIDADILIDMIEVGMNVPHPDEIFAKAREKKLNAAELMKEKNVDAAKAFLVESKRLEQRGKQLYDMLQEVETIKKRRQLQEGEVEEGGGEAGALQQVTDLDTLEAMLDNDDNNTTNNGKSKQQQQEQKQKDDNRTAEEIKKEVFRLKDEKKIKEATMMLKLYKQKLAEENLQNDIRKRQDVIKDICNHELPLAKEQIKLYQFYDRFIINDDNDGDDSIVIGSKQLKLWKQYEQDCQLSIKKLQESIDTRCNNSKVDIIRDGICISSSNNEKDKNKDDGAEITTTNANAAAASGTGATTITKKDHNKVMLRITNYDEKLSFVGTNNINNKNNSNTNTNTNITSPSSSSSSSKTMKDPFEVGILSVLNLKDNRHYQKLIKDQMRQQKKMQRANAAALKEAGGPTAEAASKAKAAVSASSSLPLSSPSCGRYPVLQGTIKVQVIVQIPPNEHDTDVNIKPLMFSSCSSLLHQVNIENDVNENVNDDQYDTNNEGNYDGSFGLSQFINLPRLPKNMDRREIRKQQKNGELSKSDIEYAKIIQRRMERKKIIINIYYDPTPPPPPSSSLTKNRHKLSPIKFIGGLFHNKNKRKSSSSNYYDRESSSSSHDDDDDDEENEANDGGRRKSKSQEEVPKKWKSLGKVIIDLNHFLNHNYIAGDFPLMDTARKELGGFVRLGMKTNEPFGTTATTNATTASNDDNDDTSDDDKSWEKVNIKTTTTTLATTGMAHNLDMKPYNAMIFRPIIKPPPENK